MAYYLAGDYYMAGDPFIGGLLKKVGGVIGGGISGFLSGGPLGAVRGAAGSLLGSRPPQAVPTSFARTGAYPQLRIAQPPQGIGGRIRTAAQALVPGGVEPGAGCPPGYHLDKQTQSKCVKNRRMNPANPRALRRAIRREAAFISLAKRTLKGSGYTFKRTGVARKRRSSRR